MSTAVAGTWDSPLEKKWRKCMGIEPTNRMFSIRLNGFEDRGPHQGNYHFHKRLADETILIVVLAENSPDGVTANQHLKYYLNKTHLAMI